MIYFVPVNVDVRGDEEKILPTVCLTVTTASIPMAPQPHNRLIQVLALETFNSQYLNHFLNPKTNYFLIFFCIHPLRLCFGVFGFHI